uniref:Trichome birefringence-like N-terminal domain-containing protein n=1 Tax=Zea mays TaxID=4577 RepID=A0A804MR36_MAIZE
MPLLARSTTAGPRRRAFVLALLLLPPLFLILLHRTSSPSLRPLPAPRKPSSRSQSCDYSAGEWVRDPLAGSSLRYDNTCKEIFKGWNCIANGKPNARDLLSWRWRPVGPGCELPRLDPRRFLEHLRDTSIGFVGDSLNRNMFASLVCMLRGVSGEVRKWRPAEADRGFTFLRYNLTVAYHRTNLLVHYGGQQIQMEVL